MIQTESYLEYYETLLRFDPARAIAIAREYYEGAGGIVPLYADLIAPALAHTGAEWQAGRIAPSHEHYITEITRDVIRRFGPEPWIGALMGGPVAVAASAPGDLHALGLLMAGDILRTGGLDVHALGADTPADAVGVFAVEIGARLLCVSASLPDHLEGAADLIRSVRSSLPGIVVLAGGRAFGGDRSRAEAIGADYHAGSLRELAGLVPELIEAAVGPRRAG